MMLFLENRINGVVYSNIVSEFLHENSAFRTSISMFDVKIDFTFFTNKSSIHSD